MRRTLFLVVVLCGWAAVHAAGVVTDDALPGPLGVLRVLGADLGTGDYWSAIADTLRSAAGGLLAAILIGVPIGLATGTWAFAERSTRLLTEVGRSFPVIAVLPVMLLIMGSSLEMKGVVVFIACLFPLIIQAQYGARSVSEAIEETAMAYRIPRLLRYRKVVLPAAAPSVMTGIRLASTMAVLVSVGVEVLTTVPGIGHVVVQSQQDGNAENAFAYIFTAGAIGYAINRLSQYAEHRLLSWRTV
ncbi:ABC transporter permease [Actinoplanes sp. NPDC051851]|uniref:ABC transporter permease n=1 Tax=Actinoplanes sp. NPDC051851 TaxID=3154753 RepID=UPI00341E008B